MDGTREATVCPTCGGFGSIGHQWTEGTCLLPHRYDKPAHPPAATVGFCCAWHVQRHRDALAEIVELYATLADVLEPGSIPDDTAEHGKPKKAPASPAPVRLEAWAMLFDTDRMFLRQYGSDLPDVPAVLTGWADATWEAMHYTATVPTTVSGAAAILTANADTIAALPWVDDYDAELGWVRNALRRAHGLTTPHPLGDCLTVGCEGRVWRDPDGDGRPKCDRCARRYGTLDIVRLHVHERKASA